MATKSERPPTANTPSAAEAAPPIETHGLSRRFGSVAAVDAVSLTVAPGEIFGLIGSNGAGKSTLVKMLTTLLPPTAGSARVAGFDITREAAARPYRRSSSPATAP